MKPGDSATLRYWRDGKLRSSEVKLGNRPANFAAQQAEGSQGGGGGSVPFPFPSP
jgi:hypothetical protein